MQFDPKNNVNKLCANGMMLEGEGKHEDAAKLFQQALDEATNDVERFTAAHYIARQQNSVQDKLKWDQTALNLALKIDNREIASVYPSLYLNVAKCFEDLKDFVKANENYLLALNFTHFLPNDGYGDMIRAGINNGLKRIN